MGKPRTKARVKPELLVWARKTCHYELDEAAKKAGVSALKLEAWESGEDRPSIPQLRKLAEVYKRPLAVFYLASPPRDFDAMRDFRRIQAAETDESPALALEIRWARRMRDVAIEAFAAADIEFPAFGLHANLQEEASEVGRRLRAALGVPLSAQRGWTAPYDALAGWREAIEGLGVLCFQFTGVSVSEARGFSMFHEELPIVAVNAKDAPAGRIFSLCHELAHLMLGAAGKCDLHETRGGSLADKTEVFCNAVAAEVLVPGDALTASAVLRSHGHSSPWSNAELDALVREFRVSEEVIVRRLLSHGLASLDFYRRKRDEYAAYEDKAGGGGNYYNNLKTKVGTPIIRGVMAAYHSGRITANEASAYLGVKIQNFDKLLNVAG